MSKASPRPFFRLSSLRVFRLPFRLKDQPLAVQFLLAGGVLAFFCVVSLVLLLSQVNSQTHASHFLSQAHRTISRLNGMSRDFHRQDRALQEFVRTREPRQAQAVREGMKSWADGYQLVDRLISDGTPDDHTLKDLQEKFLAWAAYSAGLIDRLSVGGPGKVENEDIKSTEEALRIDASLYREVFLRLDQVIASQNRQVAMRDQQDNSATRATFLAIAAINILLMIVFGVVLAKLYFSIASPISELSRCMTQYQGGDFGARVRVSNRSQIGFLESSFNEMATKIEAMVDDLKRLDDMKSEFISTVSHELRTPLTAIGGYAKLLVSGDAGPVDETQREFLYIIDTNVVRLTNLINDLLDVEKMESGKVQLIKQPEDLVSVLKEVQGTFGLIAAQKGIALEFKVPTQLPFVLGERDRLVQVFMNLVSNAIKYTPQGRILVEAEEHGYAVNVHIRDTGVGMTAEERTKIFQKFYRARGGLSSGETGTGLGLVIVKGLVEAHGGTISVDSIPGQGTSFHVSLPATAPIVEIQEYESLPGEAAGASAPVWSKPIWLIDASAPDVDRMAQVLESAGPLFRGYQLSCRKFARLADVPEALRPEEAPFMVIFDPEDGVPIEDSLTSLRRRLHRTVPVVVVSLAAEIAEAFSAGASALITKPIDEREFLIAVKDLISAKGWRILIADRNTDLRLLLKRAFEQRGFHVDDVDRGSAVLSRLEHEDYDLVLLDMNLPDVSGRELLKVIRRNVSSTALPVFVMQAPEKGAASESDVLAWGAQAQVGKSRGIGGVVDPVCRYLEDRKLEDHKSRETAGEAP